VIITRIIKRKAPHGEYGTQGWSLTLDTDELGLQIPKTADPEVLAEALRPAFYALQKLLIDRMWAEGTMSEEEYKLLLNSVTIPPEKSSDSG